MKKGFLQQPGGPHGTTINSGLDRIIGNALDKLYPASLHQQIWLSLRQGLAVPKERHGGVPACTLEGGKPLPPHDPGNYHELHVNSATTNAKGKPLEAQLEEMAAHIRFLQVTAERQPGFACLQRQPHMDLIAALRHAAALHAQHVGSSYPLAATWPYGGEEPCWEPLFAQISPQQQLWLMADVLTGLAAPTWSCTEGVAREAKPPPDSPMHIATFLSMLQGLAVMCSAENDGAGPHVPVMHRRRLLDPDAGLMVRLPTDLEAHFTVHIEQPALLTSSCTGEPEELWAAMCTFLTAEGLLSADDTAKQQQQQQQQLGHASVLELRAKLKQLPFVEGAFKEGGGPMAAVLALARLATSALVEKLRREAEEAGLPSHGAARLLRPLCACQCALLLAIEAAAREAECTAGPSYSPSSSSSSSSSKQGASTNSQASCSGRTYVGNAPYSSEHQAAVGPSQSRSQQHNKGYSTTGTSESSSSAGTSSSKPVARRWRQRRNAAATACKDVSTAITLFHVSTSVFHLHLAAFKDDRVNTQLDNAYQHMRHMCNISGSSRSGLSDADDADDVRYSPGGGGDGSSNGSLNSLLRDLQSEGFNMDGFTLNRLSMEQGDGLNKDALIEEGFGDSLDSDMELQTQAQYGSSLLHGMRLPAGPVTEGMHSWEEKPTHGLDGFQGPSFVDLCDQLMSLQQLVAELQLHRELCDDSMRSGASGHASKARQGRGAYDSFDAPLHPEAAFLLAQTRLESEVECLRMAAAVVGTALAQRITAAAADALSATAAAKGAADAPTAGTGAATVEEAQRGKVAAATASMWHLDRTLQELLQSMAGSTASSSSGDSSSHSAAADAPGVTSTPQQQQQQQQQQQRQGLDVEWLLSQRANMLLQQGRHVCVVAALRQLIEVGAVDARWHDCHRLAVLRAATYKNFDHLLIMDVADFCSMQPEIMQDWRPPDWLPEWLADMEAPVPDYWGQLKRYQKHLDVMEAGSGERENHSSWAVLKQLVRTLLPCSMQFYTTHHSGELSRPQVCSLGYQMAQSLMHSAYLVPFPFRELHGDELAGAAPDLPPTQRTAVAAQFARASRRAFEAAWTPIRHAKRLLLLEVMAPQHLAMDVLDMEAACALKQQAIIAQQVLLTKDMLFSSDEGGDMRECVARAVAVLPALHWLLAWHDEMKCALKQQREDYKQDPQAQIGGYWSLRDTDRVEAMELANELCQTMLPQVAAVLCSGSSPHLQHPKEWAASWEPVPLCDECGGSARAADGQLISCDGCGMARYCGPVCCKAAAKHHARYCRLICAAKEPGNNMLSAAKLAQWRACSVASRSTATLGRQRANQMT